MYKLIYHRYGRVYEEEYETIEKAKDFWEYLSDYGEGFPEYIVDEKNIILYDGKVGVIGIDHESEVGKEYIPM